RPGCAYHRCVNTNVRFACEFNRHTMERAFQEAKNEVQGGAFGGQLDFVDTYTARNDLCTRLKWQRRHDYTSDRPRVLNAESESPHVFLRHSVFCIPATFNNEESLIVYPNALCVDLPSRTARSWDDLLPFNPTKAEVHRHLAYEVLGDFFVRAPRDLLRHASSRCVISGRPSRSARLHREMRLLLFLAIRM